MLSQWSTILMAMLDSTKIVKSFQLIPAQNGFWEREAKWVFFATSHGKQPCDGVGGKVK